MRTYLDVAVHVSAQGPGAYLVRVESDAGGQASASFTLDGMQVGTPTAPPGAERAIGTLTAAPGDAPDPAAPDPAALGAALFGALFRDETRDVFFRTDGRAGGGDMGVRIRLSMDLAAQGMAAVASLPWELIRRGAQSDPFVVSTQTPLVRAFDLPEPASPPAFVAPLRVMALMSNPKGSAPLDLDREKALIGASWAKLPGVVVDFVAPVETAIRAALAAHDYHVVHYMGHGGFDPATGGMLLMEDADGNPALVSGETFAAWLLNEPLRLVFLNACQSGTTAPHDGLHPFAGVAAALLRQGVPAVLAMQRPISDKAAIVFAQSFYERIADRDPVDAAVATGRQMLYTGPTSSGTEWATPVFYLRARDSMLFAADTPAPSGPAAPWAGRDGFRILLAPPPPALASAQAQLATALGALDGVAVATVPDAAARDAYDAALDALLRDADLCVHLLGADAGAPLGWSDPGDPLDTAPVGVLRRGLDIARAQLVVMPREDRDSLAPGPYADWIGDLGRMPRAATRFELQVIDKLRLVDAVVAKRDALVAARSPAVAVPAPAAPAAAPAVPAVRTAVVDAHVVDDLIAADVFQFLAERSVDATIETSSAAAADDLATLDGNVRASSLYVIVAGAVDPGWVAGRKAAVIKSAMIARKPIVVAEYAAAPGEDGSAPIVSARLRKVGALNDSGAGWIDALFAPPADAAAGASGAAGA